MNGVSDTSIDLVGTIMLVATKAAALVVFKTGASAFNKGIIIHAIGGVILSQSVATKDQLTEVCSDWHTDHSKHHQGPEDPQPVAEDHSR